MYKAEMLADSKCPRGNRLTTMKITFPRFVLAEMNTHRMFSRNSASSRAIPFNKMVKMVEENPFIPIAWQRDHKGMQGTEYLDEKTLGLVFDYQSSNYTPTTIRGLWLEARDAAIEIATELNKSKVTKQLCNRLLEPFMWHTVIITATEWDNFFKLRCPQYTIDNVNFFKSKKDLKVFYSKTEAKLIKSFKLNHSNLFAKDSNIIAWLKINESRADIHIQAIAELMWDAYNENKPKELEAGEWHIPFGDNFDENDLYSVTKKLSKYNTGIVDTENSKIKIATARCGRISYETLGDNPKIDYESDIKLHDRLMDSGHWSPFEHIAVVMTENQYLSSIKGELGFEDTIEDTITEKTVMYLDGVDLDNPSTGWCNNFRGFIQYRYLVDNIKQTIKN